MVVLSNSRLAAGVRLPGASALRGVQLGGGIALPLALRLAGVDNELRPKSGVELPRKPALVRRLFAAFADNL